MSVLLIVVPLALLVVGLAVGAYIWSAGDGQFDDLETPAMRMVHEDGDVVPPATPPATRRP
jgi:cbb3-type cytochrome oxidase maturation protein